MAELDVQPKRRNSFLPWLLFGLTLIVLLFFVVRRLDDNMKASTARTTTTTATSTTSHAATSDANRDWTNINFSAPAVTYTEITERDIMVKGSNDYSIYSLEEKVLFDEGQSTLRPDAAKNLQQVATSIRQRYGNGQVRIYGYTDAAGSAEVNKQLAMQRAEAVQNWLSKNGNIPADKISLHPVGEASPVASNATAEGRQQNRRVEIVARRV